jgi:hypothetical protein
MVRIQVRSVDDFSAKSQAGKFLGERESGSAKGGRQRVAACLS